MISRLSAKETYLLCERRLGVLLFPLQLFLLFSAQRVLASLALDVLQRGWKGPGHQVSGSVPAATPTKGAGTGKHEGPVTIIQPAKFTGQLEKRLFSVAIAQDVSLSTI